jgi:lipoprotein-releasing system ATP-binding protein
MADATSPVLLSCRGLTKVYRMPSVERGGERELHVLRGVDLDIHRGEMVSVVGHSGVGKSTLLHILGTLDEPTAGTLAYGEEVTGSLSSRALADFRNRRIGFIFQFHHLLAEFSALDNVMLPALISGMSRTEASRRAEPLLCDVGLAERLQHKPGELSGGEQQRVAVARALVMEPEVVFADEPTGNLDGKTSSEIHALLGELNERTGTAFVVVTHNVQLAWLMGRHLLLQGGLVRELTGDETPETFLPARGGVNP